MNEDKQCEIIIGDFIIRVGGDYTDDKTFWISRQSGEGGQFKKDEFEQVVKTFYKEHF